jgi:excisionase family DNA binding protein
MQAQTAKTRDEQAADDRHQAMRRAYEAWMRDPRFHAESDDGTMTGASAKGARGRLMTAGEVAAYLSVTKSWVYAEARAQRMPHVRLGGYVRFRRDAIDEWSRRASAEVGKVPDPTPPDEGTDHAIAGVHIAGFHAVGRAEIKRENARSRGPDGSYSIAKTNRGYLAWISVPATRVLTEAERLELEGCAGPFMEQAEALAAVADRLGALSAILAKRTRRAGTSTAPVAEQ